MPSAKKQLNVRADDEDLDLIARLIPAVKARLGLSRLSQSELVRMGLKELEKKYLSGAAGQASTGSSAPAAATAPPSRRGKRSRKARA